jgi:hypothetical protein
VFRGSGEQKLPIPNHIAHAPHICFLSFFSHRIASTFGAQPEVSTGSSFLRALPTITLTAYVLEGIILQVRG